MAELRETLLTYSCVLRAQFVTALAVQLQYRVVLLIWLIYFVLKPLMFLSVWGAVARSRGGQVGGYEPPDLAAYFLATMWLVHLTFNGAFVFFEGRVRRGEFSPLLLRPVHPMAADVAENVAYKVLTAPVLAAASVPLLITLAPRFEPSPWAALAVVPAVLLAYALRFVTTWTVALASFWLTRAQAVALTYLTVLLFLGGEAAPLALLPEWAQTLAWLSPFPWMLAFPAELLLGRLTPAQAASGIGIQAVWTAASFALLALCWRAAVKRYSAVGA